MLSTAVHTNVCLAVYFGQICRKIYHLKVLPPAFISVVLIHRGKAAVSLDPGVRQAWAGTRISAHTWCVIPPEPQCYQLQVWDNRRISPIS